MAVLLFIHMERFKCKIYALLGGGGGEYLSGSPVDGLGKIHYPEKDQSGSPVDKHEKMQ